MLYFRYDGRHPSPSLIQPELNCHFPVRGRSCTSHRQALAATATQLYPISGQILIVVVWADVVRYAVERRVLVMGRVLNFVVEEISVLYFPRSQLHP